MCCCGMMRFLRQNVKSVNQTDVRKLILADPLSGRTREDGLAEAVEKKFLGRMGDNVSDRMKHEVKQLSKVAAKRGKKRFEKIVDTGKSDAEDY